MVTIKVVDMSSTELIEWDTIANLPIFCILFFDKKIVMLGNFYTHRR